jgi:hypothetical protein
MEHFEKCIHCAFAPLRTLRETHSCYFVPSSLHGKKPPRNLYFLTSPR